MSVLKKDCKLLTLAEAKREKLDKFNIFNEKCTDDKWEIKNLRAKVERIYLESIDLSANISSWQELYMEAEKDKKPSPEVSNEMPKLSIVERYRRRLDYFLDRLTPSVEHIRELYPKILVFLGELETRHKKIVKARTIEELHDISLVEPYEMDQGLLRTAYCMDLLWEKMDLKKKVDKYLKQLEGQVKGKNGTEKKEGEEKKLLRNRLGPREMRQ